MKYFKIIFLFVSMSLTISCSDYLDIVPDGVATMDNAFSNRVNAEKFLLTCYSRLPNPVSYTDYPALIGGDEIWWDHDYPNYRTWNCVQIALGNQEANNPWQNYWDGSRGGSNLFVAIRDCNIFLENIHKPFDLDGFEKTQWTAEVKFLKAYLHLFLLQLYGPIPIIRENLPVSATPEEVRMYREPVDDVINYIVELIDEAVPDLPMQVRIPVSDAGRITKPIALAVKAKALVWAASPLFNGNNDYGNFVDNKGRQLISSGEPDPAKWARAAVAIKNAIDTCYLGRHALYKFTPGSLAGDMSDTTRLKYALRGAVTDKFNQEIVWPDTHDVNSLQHKCMPLHESGNYNVEANEIGATLKIAEEFYSNKGIPINEDPDWDYAGRYDLQKAGADHKYYIQNNESTAKLNFYREPRFYAFLGFDRGIWEGSGRDEANSWYIMSRQGEASGMRSSHDHLVTGYHIKKLINVNTAWNGNTTSKTNVRYSYPLIRLPDLFLLYAEALNEIGGPGPEVYKWIDTVRLRAGLKGVVESWAQSSVPDKPTTKDGLREIIKRERTIELSFEGQRFWDLRRWKDAVRYLNEPVKGWNYNESAIEKYYAVTNVWTQRLFIPRDYLWPLKVSSVIVNSNLVQNPGW
ncbi:MAG: RagB/SusD family nutrient uptake outer membrane protein [Prevotellaceae bacterium]|jgi:hypothetical protein|nr:RagB/SusD family nutrient uptake outer membrane protein [Prevotellaceae bacterium]